MVCSRKQIGTFPLSSGFQKKNKYQTLFYRCTSVAPASIAQRQFSTRIPNPNPNPEPTTYPIGNLMLTLDF